MSDTNDYPPTTVLFVKDQAVQYECFESWIRAAQAFEIYSEVYPEAVAIVSGGETIGFHVEGERTIELNINTLQSTFKPSKVYKDYRISPEILAKLDPEEAAAYSAEHYTEKPKATKRKRTAKKSTTTAAKE